MGKDKKATNPNIVADSYKMPLAPWIYMIDPTPGSYITSGLAKLIPTPELISVAGNAELLEAQCSQTKNGGGICIFRDTRGDEGIAVRNANLQVLKAAAIRDGRRFVSVNVVEDGLQAPEVGAFETSNHLDIRPGADAADNVCKWLFNVLTIRESLHLISDAQMKEIDTKLFPDYEYCPINEARLRPNDAKVQFVALILTKPQVMKDGKIIWTVADKTGVANFSFQYRGENSQRTWDWVMNLKPGERKALPRMAMVLVKEKRRYFIVKAPFRATAAVVHGVGSVVKYVGRGICKVGEVIKLGPGSEWIPEADIDANGKKIDWSRRMRALSKGAREDVTTPPTKKCDAWDDGASVASTQAGSEKVDDKMKEFL